MCFVPKSTSELIMLTVSRTIKDEKLHKSINYIRRLIQGNFYPSFLVIIYFVFCYVDDCFGGGGGSSGAGQEDILCSPELFCNM